MKTKPIAVTTCLARDLARELAVLNNLFAKHADCKCSTTAEVLDRARRAGLIPTPPSQEPRS